MTLPKMKKLYYSIREVSSITDVSQPTLRFWENEFDMLQPGKNSAGNRIYKETDIKMVLLIKHLLYTEKLSINEGNKYLQTLHENNQLNETLNKYSIELSEINKKETSKGKVELSVRNYHEDEKTSIFQQTNRLIELLKIIKEEIDKLNQELEKIQHE
ncbi:MAG: MerR family transcriptional regulator [Candidatus Marinimicrobia bacterium]|nr:MerR family transcriptional regulator [Candidatus Neomarinimicrobiota bacterium]MDD5582948.1 MerR family transcriptional regulator [Candidatus Neomarinimicrobiota bacterium]